MDRPISVETLDAESFNKLFDLCEEYLNEVEGRPRIEDSDTPHYIFEETMKLIYGPNVFDWINSKTGSPWN